MNTSPRPAVRPAVRRSLPATLAAAVLLVAAAGATAARAAATIEKIEPPGGPRGAEVEITLTGKLLGAPRELVFEEGRVAVASLTPVDDRHVRAVVRIAADCPPGPQRFRVRTAEGLSELRTFRVGVFEQVAEREPNDDPGTAQEIAGPRTVSGVVKGEDIDCYRVHLTAGARISAVIDGIRLDQEMFDPHLDLVDARGFTVAACDDHLLLGPDAMLTATVPAAGDYCLRVRESVYGGNDGCVYLLHVGDFPIPHMAWPPAGRPGAAFEVEWLGDPRGGFRSSIVLPAAVDPAGVAEIRPQSAGDPSPVGVPLRVSMLEPTADGEPNDEPDSATAAAAPGALLGRMDRADDVDWYRVRAAKGTAWNVRGWGRRIGSPIDLVINAHRDDGKRERLTGNDDTDGPDSAIRVTVPDTGSFLLRVNDHLRRGGEAFAYWIEIEPAEPLVTLSVPPSRSGSQERLVAAVPRGNRTAVLFNTARSDFGDPLTIAFAGLPPGVQATAPTVPTAAAAAPVVFEAAADAADGTAFADVAPLAANDRRRVGALRQATELVFGPNNTAYRASVSDRLPVAVIDPAPIRIEVERPTVPLVRRGSMDLLVRIERLDGFTGPVKLGFPFKPPGIGAAATVDVPEDRSEVAYPLNANGDAPLGEWQVVVTGMGRPKGRDGDNATAWVSSRPTPIRVAEPLIELATEKAVAEQGREVSIVWKVKKPAVFAGVAKAKLLGLPPRVEAPEVELSSDGTELVFPVKVAEDAPAGVHGNVFCQVSVPLGNAWVVHATPPTQLRIDRPLTAPAAGAKP
jgi:hypothetical protein